MLRILALAFTLVCHLAVAVASPTAAGTWAAVIEGERVVVVLDAGGRGTINGDPAAWAQDASGVQVQASDGTIYRGRLASGALQFTIEGTVVSFARAGAAPEAKRPERPELKPAKLLAGKRVQHEGTELSFVVPRGWTSGWEAREGQEVYVLALGKDVAILGSARQLTGNEATLGPAALLERWSPATAALRTVEAAAEFTVKNQPGAIVVRASTKPAAHMAASVVVVDGWGIVMIALSPPAKAKVARAALETVLATLEGKVPAAAETTRAAAGGVLGCWTAYESFGKSGSTTRKVIIANDGSYSWTGRTNFAGTGSSVTSEVGTWTLRGTQLELVPRDGKTETYTVRLAKGALYLSGMKLRACSR